MERLTEHWCDGMIRIKGCSTAYSDKERKGAPATNAIVRLAAYEDTGLTPEEIAEVQAALEPIPFGRFSTIMEAERAERLVLLDSNPPLTLEQLKEMDGEPVWCARWGVWGLVDIGLAAVITCKGDLDINDEGIHERLYRRKPEGGEAPC